MMMMLLLLQGVPRRTGAPHVILVEEGREVEVEQEEDGGGGGVWKSLLVLALHRSTPDPGHPGAELRCAVKSSSLGRCGYSLRSNAPSPWPQQLASEDRSRLFF